MNLPPPFPTITDEILYSIAEHHHLKIDKIIALPQVGIFNKIYQLGDDFIIRISRDHPKSLRIAHTEAIAVPLARAAGVRTPALLVCDVSLHFLSAPYTIYERIRGETLGLLNLEPYDTPAAWRALGHDLALLHACVIEDGPATELDYNDLPDPRAWPDELAEAGYFTTIEAKWLRRWLEHLAPAVLAPVQRRFRHGDVQATNMMVSPKSFDYLALIDWGNAHWGDPAFDFGGPPIRTVPYVLEGYRQVMPLENDETAEARILWRHLQLALHNLWQKPQPEYAWAERPLPFLLDIMRFLLEIEDSRWRQLVV